jgi:hypothetical protein
MGYGKAVDRAKNFLDHEVPRHQIPGRQGAR